MQITDVRVRKITKEGHGKASDCIHCGQCARQCPQHIQIPEWMDKIAAILE